MTNEEAHKFAREKGVSKIFYAVVLAIVRPLFRLYFRMHVDGVENIPTDGPAIIAPNHKSFWDSFFVGLCTNRHLRFMGKSELFQGWQGPVLIRLGAFPVRRGEADEDAMETARTILRQGGLLALFPEGTRVRDPEALGDPRRGAGRLAIEMGAPMVPTAITGTESLFAGPFPKPRRVQVAFSEPIAVDDVDPTPEGAGELMGERLWPEVEEEYSRLRARPGVIAAGLAAAGIGAGLAVRSRRASKKKKPPWRR
jgi:1-acyl-sn-glycerol-3-phosphate acyltransferase